MLKKKNPKISIVIAVFKPDEKIFQKLKEKLKEQTIKAELIENWNMPEAKSMNIGIKKAKGEIIITLAQDCIPEDKFWLEKLVSPLVQDKNIAITVSDLYLPEFYWKKYPFLTKMMTINELEIRLPNMDSRACAYRKKDLEKVGLFNEDPNVIGIDNDLYRKMKSLGEIIHPGVNVLHMHPLNNEKKIKLDYKYSLASGKIVRKFGVKDHAFFKRLIRATPILGLVPILLAFPLKKYPLLFPTFLLISPISHFVYVFGFWKGLIIKD